jgi:hypothetical protein
MGGEEPGEDLNSPKGNSMTLSTILKREVMVPPFFVNGLIGFFGLTELTQESLKTWWTRWNAKE